MVKFNVHFQIILVFLLICCFSNVSAQQTNAKQIIADYDSAINMAPREKLYVHFDKPVYAQQDTLWFKAYLVNATLNNLSSLSGIIYTDLINSNGDVVNTLALPTIFGLTWGGFALTENRFPPGVYTFRAYTKWMQNFGDMHIFKREISIVGMDQTMKPVTASSTQRMTGTKIESRTRASNQFDIQFLPEGGTWLQGANQKMAFKAINAAGMGVAVSGEVTNAKQEKVADFKSNRNGMGYFTMAPLADNYKAKIQMGSSVVEKNLPVAKVEGTALQLDLHRNPDSLMIVIYSTLVDQDLTVIGQSKGIICFVAVLKANVRRKIIKVAKSTFSTGVCQILVINDKKQLINERNFFLNFNDQLKVTSQISAPSFGVRDSIPIQLKAVNHVGEPVSASFSMAITDDGQVSKNEANDANILSYLLLTSDLKGEIENPGQYFADENPTSKEDLDALMLTQGWVSYAWPKEKKPIYKPEKEYLISGSVTNLTNKPVEGAKVTILGRNKGVLLLDTLTNKNGEFVFSRLPRMDSASLVIQALNAKGKRGTLGITLNEFVRPPFVAKVKNSQAESSLYVDSVTSQLIATKKQTEEAALKSGIVLREVKIVGKRSVKGSKNLNGAGEASQTLTETELEPLAKKTLYDVLLTKIKGFRQGTRRKSMVRDFFINGDLARFVIDGVELDFFYQPFGGSSLDDYFQFVKSYLDYYSAEDITGIETMENGLSFRYKSEFKNPMDEATYAFLEITTKTGSGPFLRKSANMYLLKPINYGDTKVFYEPRYTSVNKKNPFPDYRSTLYWNPNIVTDKNGEAVVSFYAADKKGTYTVWIEGSDTQGGIGMKTFKIEIK